MRRIYIAQDSTSTIDPDNFLSGSMFWKRRMIMRLSYQETENNQLEAMLPHIDILSDSVPVNALGKFPGCRDVIVTRPTPTYLFLHGL